MRFVSTSALLPARTLTRVFRSCGLGLALLTIWAGDGLEAATTLRFPRLVLDPDTLTGVAVVNPDSQPVLATFTAYGSDGLVLQGEGLQNPREVLIFPGQQYARTTREIFGSLEGLSEAAWFEVTSPASDLTGFFLVLDTNLRYLDGADLPLPSLQLIFPEIRISETENTEINLVNPGTSPVQARLQLGGSVQREETIDLPARGASRLDVQTFFGLQQAVGPVWLSVQADGPVAGFAFVRTGADWLGVNARPADLDRRSLFFPQFAVLGGFESQLKIFNTGDQPVDIVLTAYRPEGVAYAAPAVSSNPVLRRLEPGELLCEELEALFGFQGSEILQGWIGVESSGPGLEGSLTYALPQTGALAAVVAESEGRRELLFSHIATSLGFFTGVALQNSATISTNVQVVALTAQGEMAGETHLVIGPRQRLSRLLTELIPSAAGLAGGFVWIRSDLPLRATSLFGTMQSRVLANIPPQSLPSYQPADLPPVLRVEPALATVGPGSQVAFTLPEVSRTVNWIVAGNLGGDEASGTITVLGDYLAPLQAPPLNPVTVSAQLDGRSFGATLDWLDSREILSDVSGLRALAHLADSDTLYTAERSAPVGLGVGPAQPAGIPSGGTSIYGHAPGGRQLLATLANQEVSALLGFRASDGLEYLLAATGDAGELVRIDPRSGARTTLAGALREPHQLFLDSSGDLLVVEEHSIARISRADLNRSLAGQAIPAGAGSNRLSFGGARVQGVAEDPCAERLLVATDEGIIAVSPESGTVLAEVADLADATGLVALRRQGLECDRASHLLVLSRSGGRLIGLGSGEIRPWLEQLSPEDHALLTSLSSSLGAGGVLLVEPFAASRSRVLLVELSHVYRLN